MSFTDQLFLFCCSKSTDNLLADCVKKEINQMMIDLFYLFMLHPMRGIREEDQIAILAIIQTGTCHAPGEGNIINAPQDQGPNVHTHIICDLRSVPECGAIPIQHSRHGPRS